MACIKPPKLLTAGQPSAAVTAALFAGDHHVFDSVVEGGTIKGGHHLQDFDLSSVDEAVIDVATGNARYHVRVGDRDTSKSMFDQGKSRQEVKEILVEALRQPTLIKIEGDRRVVEGQSQGTAVRLVIERDGTLKTAYPLIPGPKDYTKEGGRMELSHERAARLARQRRP